MKRLSLVVLACTWTLGCDGSAPTDKDLHSGDDSPTDDSPSDDSSTDDSQPVEVLEISPALVLDGPRPQNVVVITMDTLRRDHINAFGYAERTTTPLIDRLLQEGVSLEAHRSCSSWTYPSMLCALTGEDQVSLGYWPPNHLAELPPRADDSLTLMAERFADAGYHTMLASASGFLGQASNTDQGFAEGEGRFNNGDGSYVDGAQLLAEVTAMMAARPDDTPFFLHVHLLDAHMPYAPPVRYLTELEALEPTAFDLSTEEGTLNLWRGFSDLGPVAQEINLQHLAVRYDGAIRYADDQLALMVSRFEDQGLWEDTALLLFADHGEEFREHGNFNHGYTAFEEITSGVAVFWQPGRLRPAQVTTLTTHEDLMPSLAALVGLEADEGWTGEVVGTSERVELFNLSWRGERTVQSWTDGQHKLIYRWDGERSFYDLTADPTEQNDLYDPESPEVIAAWAALLPEVERFAAVESGATPLNPGP